MSPNRDQNSERQLQPAISRGELIFWAICFVSLVIFVLLNVERGPVSTLTSNLAGARAFKPVPSLFPGLDIVFWGQLLAAIFAIGLVISFIWGWRRHPRHPLLLMVLASTTLCCLDPINNWCIYLVYNPDLWHLPQDWPWVGLSPLIEPVMNFVYAPFIITPALIAIPILRRLQARKPETSFVRMRPLLSLACITFCVTFVYDSALELFLVATQFYTYSHVVPFGSIFVGEFYQFPLLMASGVINVVVIPAAILLYQDDTGLSQAEKIAMRFSLHRTRPGTATFLVMMVILNICFVMFFSTFYVLRITGQATSVACPWPYQNSVVYDPNGFYERDGQAGPFWEGHMNNWFSGQPEGRPTEIQKISNRCSQ